MLGQQPVDAPTLRRLFNEGRYWERLQAGRLVGVVGASRHPGPPFEPYCTVSQIVRYHKRNQKRVAVVHQYLRPNGTLGASGRPDPKSVRALGILYVLDTGPPGQHRVRFLVRVVWPITRVTVRVRSVFRL